MDDDDAIAPSHDGAEKDDAIDPSVPKAPSVPVVKKEPAVAASKEPAVAASKTLAKSGMKTQFTSAELGQKGKNPNATAFVTARVKLLQNLKTTMIQSGQEFEMSPEDYAGWCRRAALHWGRCWARCVGDSLVREIKGLQQHVEKKVSTRSFTRWQRKWTERMPPPDMQL